VPGRPFKPHLMIVSKTRAYQRKTPLNVCNQLEFVSGRPLQLSLMLVSKARAYQSKAP
jgi:hypothetical protein